MPELIPFIYLVHGSCLTKSDETGTVIPSANTVSKWETDEADARLNSLAPNPGLGSDQLNRVVSCLGEWNTL